MATPAINQPSTCSNKLPSVKSSGNRYQFQYGTLTVSQENSPSAVAMS